VQQKHFLQGVGRLNVLAVMWRLAGRMGGDKSSPKILQGIYDVGGAFEGKC
jgi:hypothetical protein